MPEPLSGREIREILSRPGGACHLLELVRSGRIDADAAVTAIEAADPTPLWARVGWALLEVLTGGFPRRGDF